MKIKDIYGIDSNLKNVYKKIINWDSDSLSKFQTNVKLFLKPYWIQDIVFEEFPVPKTRLSVDFFNYTKGIIVEVQGRQHLSYSEHFHGGRRTKYLAQLKRDDLKYKFCMSNGFTLIEIYPNDQLSKELFKRLGVDL